ncbi:MAG TPA: hypothetical protein VK607_05415 [Kofleriaceae bacterium]|nr:hypothetical protein [Kofleriaceae bacterium]
MRSWLVIPAMAAAAGGAAVALGITPAVAAAAAALAAVVRVLAGDSPAALTAAAIAPLLAVATLASTGGAPVASVIALAAAGWTIAELGRPPGAASPVSPAIAPLIAVPAAVAAILDPSFAGLLAIAGVRLATAPGPRPRWVLCLPVAGGLMVVLAVLAATLWPGLGARWFGAAAHPLAPSGLAAAAAAVLGPLTAVAALAGLAAVARPRHAELALAAAIAGAILVDLRAAAVGPATIGLAALLAGLAIGRLAAMIRLASGQAIVGATLGALVLVPPAWTAVEQRAATAHIGRASR